MNSFSAVYPVKGLDESRYVDIVAKRFNTIGHRITPDAEHFLDRLARITWHQDIPTGTSGVYTQNFVMKLAHGNVTVLLDGQGADELLAGYLSYVVFHLNDLRKRNLGRWIGEQAAFCSGCLAALQCVAQFARVRLPRARSCRADRMRCSSRTYLRMAKQRRSRRAAADAAEAATTSTVTCIKRCCARASRRCCTTKIATAWHTGLRRACRSSITGWSNSRWRAGVSRKFRARRRRSSCGGRCKRCAAVGNHASAKTSSATRRPFAQWLRGTLRTKSMPS